jgi:hypothetical protein
MVQSIYLKICMETKVAQCSHIGTFVYHQKHSGCQVQLATATKPDGTRKPRVPRMETSIVAPQRPLDFDLMNPIGLLSAAVLESQERVYLGRLKKASQIDMMK